MSLHNPILDQARREEKTTKPVTANSPTDTDVTLRTSTPAGSSKLEAVQSAIATSTTRIVSSIQQLEAGIKESVLITDVIVSAIADATAATQIISRTKLNADLQAQNATIEAFEAGGGTDMQVALMTQLREDNKRVNDILDNRQELADEDRFGEGIGIIDTVLNRFNLRLTEQQLAAAEAQQSQTATQINNLGAATESFARTNAVTRKTLNEGVIEANYNSIAAESDIRAAAAKLKNVHSNATLMNNIMVADSRTVANLLSVFRVEGEVRERELREIQATNQRERMKAFREEVAIKLPAAKVAAEQARDNLTKSKLLTPLQISAAQETLAAAEKRRKDLITRQDSIVEAVQTAQSILDPDSIEERSIILFGIDSKNPKYLTLLDMGAVSDPVIGSTAFEAKLNLNTAAPFGGFKDTVATDLLDIITEKQAIKYTKRTIPIPKDIVTLRSDFNATAKEVMDEFALDIAEGNPFVAPPMSVLELNANVRNSIFYKRILKDMGMKETNPQRIVDAAVAGMIAGTISIEEAASGIESIFDAAALRNTIFNGGFRRVGLPNQTTYNTRIKVPTTFFERLKLAPIFFRGIGVQERVDELIRKFGEVEAKSRFPGAFAAIKVTGKTKSVIVDLMEPTSITALLIKLRSVEPDTKEGNE